MFSSIEKVYQIKTARIFRLLVTSPRPLSIIAFYFLDQEMEHGPQFAFGDRIKEISEDDLETIAREKSRQIQAHFGDLVQVNKHVGTDPHLRYTVGFLHQTVSAFLATTDMDELLSTRSGAYFCPSQTLSKISLASLKATGSKQLIEQGSPLFRYAFVYAHRAGTHVNKIGEEILDDAEAFIKSQKSIGTILVQSAAPDCNTVVGLALKTGIRGYVESRFEKEAELRGTAFATDILRQALCARATIDSNMTLRIQDQKEVDIQILKYVVEKNIDPNARSAGEHYTVWEQFLLQLFNALEWWPTWYDACELMVKYGAKEEVDVEGKRLNVHEFSGNFTPGNVL